MQEAIPVQAFEISDVLCELIEPLIPVREKQVHPLGCPRPRVPDRQVLNDPQVLSGRQGGLEHLAQQESEQGLCLDAGYDNDGREVAEAFGYTTHIRTRGEAAKAKEAGQKARRWVVERTQS